MTRQHFCLHRKSQSISFHYGFFPSVHRFSAAQTIIDIFTVLYVLRFKLSFTEDLDHKTYSSMTNQFCFHKLDHLRKLVELQRIFMYILCVLYLLFSIVASIGNLTVIYALWKASSMPSTVKKLFLSLAFSDLAVGILSQPMFGVIIAVMLSIAYADRYISYTSFCPTILSVFYFFNFLLSCASFMNVTAIAVDRLLAISLHLRYHEFITSKRVISALVCLWIVSFIVATLFIVLPNGNDMVAAITVCLGLFLASVAYIRIYKVVKYHQNRIQGQTRQQNLQEMEQLRQKKSAYNAFFVFLVFVACYFPLFIFVILDSVSSSQISLAGKHASIFLVLLNSSLNPVVYCWRYREIREIVKRTFKEVFCIKLTGLSSNGKRIFVRSIVPSQ